MFRTSCDLTYHTGLYPPVTFLLMVSILSGIGLAQGTPEIALRARGIFPGEVARVQVTSDRAIQNLSAEVFGKVFPFWHGREPSQWDGLVGIDLNVKAGTYEIGFKGSFVDGSPIVLPPKKLEVQPREFPTRKLTVDQKFVDPPQGTLERIREESRRVAAILSRTTSDRYWSGSFSVPVPGKANSSFGKRSILNGQPRSPHSGTDFSAGEGTPVKAPNSGVVVLADNLYFAGNTIIIDHGHGLYSYFAHLSEFSVAEGDVVERNQEIGKVGATGRVTGPHLHWAVRLVESRVDPLALIAVLEKDSGPVPQVTTNQGEH